MTLPRPISPTQTDARSPVDDNLMDSIREDLDHLDEQQTTSNPSFRFTADGPLSVNEQGATQERVLFSDISISDTFQLVSDLQFSDLIVGARYKLNYQAAMNVVISSGTRAELVATNGLNSIAKVEFPLESTGSFTGGTSVEFTAQTRVITFSFVATDGDCVLFGDGTTDETFAQLRRIDDGVEKRIIPSGKGKRIDCGVLSQASTFNACKISLEKSGFSGSMEIDLRTHNSLAIPVSSVVAQFKDEIQSISNIAPSLATQSITKATPDISTQSISFAKNALNITSIVPVATDDPSSTNYWQINLDSEPDSDHVPGNYLGGQIHAILDGTDSSNNEGILEIVEYKRGGHNCLVVYNESGEEQLGAGGTLRLNMASYNYTNPVNFQFVAGETVTLSGHDDAANNVLGVIWAINQGGNNIWIQRSNLSWPEQATPNGTAECVRKSYNFLSAVSTTDFIVGEFAKCSGHTSGASDGNKRIVGINVGGNNIVVNQSAAVQGGVDGTVDTNRWVYTLNVDPSSGVEVGDSILALDASSSNNNGTFEVKEVNRLAGNNLVVYNESGVTQAGIGGEVQTSKKLVTFSSDQSSIITAASKIEIEEHIYSEYNETDETIGHQVLEVNRGGGANYNAVIEVNSRDYPAPSGVVTVESKSLFNTLPSIDAEFIGQGYYDPNISQMKYVGFHDIGPIAKRCLKLNHTDFIDQVVPADTSIYLWINSTHGGDPRDLSVVLL